MKKTVTEIHLVVLLFTLYKNPVSFKQ